MADKLPAKRGRPKGAVTVPHAERGAIVLDTLMRLDQGETTDQIAKSHNVEPRTLRSWLLVDCPEAADHQRARYIAAQIQNAIEEISVADEQIPLARARELFKSWSWIAERRLPHLFAQKQEVSNAGAVSININLRSSDQVTIDGAATHIPQSSIGHNQGDSEKS